MSNAKPNWEKSYSEIWQDWNAKNSFGSKGEMTPQEAWEVHKKWQRLGTLAKAGLL